MILRKGFVRAADGDSDHLVTYRFSLPSGQQVVSRHGLNKSQWSELNVGAEIVIIYSATNPTRSFPEGGGATSIAGPIFFTALFGSVAFLAGAVLFQLMKGANSVGEA